jgi:hypothetical protein
MIYSFHISIALTVKTILCPISLLGLLAGFIWAVVMAFRDGITRLQRLHRVPCNRCVYFTGCHYLKCTVQPHKAMSEEAIDCLDFEPVSLEKPFYQNMHKPFIKTRSI